MNKALPTYQEGEDRVKISHFTRKGYDITGVMHVGTNYGYEFEQYRKMGIEYFIGFEPLPSAIEAFQKNYPTLATGKEFFFPVALGDTDSIKALYVRAGDGQSSSFYEEFEPEQELVGMTPLKIRRFDEFAQSIAPTLPMDRMNCLVLDVEGMELEVLGGMGFYLEAFDFLNIECSEKPFYKGAPAAGEIIDWLAKAGFEQDSPIEPHNDIFFIKKALV